MPFVTIDGVRLEYAWFLPAGSAAAEPPSPYPVPQAGEGSGRAAGDKRADRPLLPPAGEGWDEGLAAGAIPIVMLHEGLGSLAMWRDFPQRVAGATRARVLVYSRRGYGQSDPLTGPRKVDYMHGEAQDVLPKLLRALHLKRPLLVGHSDGASIAILHAGSGNEVAGLVLMAPHVFVEDLTVASIAAIKEVWKSSDMGQRLGRYHRDAEHTFWGWNDIWLLPAFKQWNIEAFVPRIAAPMLVIQGRDDEYGTPAQCEAIEARTKAPCELLLLENCKHSPHRDQPESTLQAIARFHRALAS